MRAQTQAHHYSARTPMMLHMLVFYAGELCLGQQQKVLATAKRLVNNQHMATRLNTAKSRCPHIPQLQFCKSGGSHLGFGKLENNCNIKERFDDASIDPGTSLSCTHHHDAAHVGFLCRRIMSWPTAKRLSDSEKAGEQPAHGNSAGIPAKSRCPHIPCCHVVKVVGVTGDLGNLKTIGT